MILDWKYLIRCFLSTSTWIFHQMWAGQSVPGTLKTSLEVRKNKTKIVTWNHFVSYPLHVASWHSLGCVYCLLSCLRFYTSVCLLYHHRPGHHLCTSYAPSHAVNTHKYATNQWKLGVVIQNNYFLKQAVCADSTDNAY